MKKVLRSILTATIISGLLISGISCGDAPPSIAESWDNPEKFVLYDVNRYVDITVDNNRLLLEEEYGKELAKLGMWIWDSYAHTTNRPVVGDISRFEDGCWVTVSDILVARVDASFAEATFYYIFHNDRWQLDYIECVFFDSDGLELPELAVKFSGQLR